MNQDLFDDLMEYALKYTDTTREELLSMWDDARAAAEKYGSFTNAIQMHPGGDSSTRASEIMSEMRSNGTAWAASSNQQERDWYAKQNESLAEELSGLLGTPVTKDKNGVWWVNGQRLFDDYASHAGSASGSKRVQQIYEEMKANGRGYASSTDKKTQNYYVQANEALAEELSKLLRTPVTKDKDGYWLANGQRLPIYHSGGIVGGQPTLKQKELLAVLERNEMVLNEQHQDRMLSAMQNMEDMSASVERMNASLNFKVPSWMAGTPSQQSFTINAPLTINGVSDQVVLDTMKRYPRQIVNYLAANFNTRGGNRLF